ncbi:hypothetical protein COCHEDRAFT_1063065, partial [Bipolaris maydis C5]
MPNGSLKYNQPELAKIATTVVHQVMTLQQQWQEKANSWQFEPESSNGLLQDEQEYRNLISKNRTYVPPHMRSDLIKELHESPEYGHAGIEEMVRRLAKVFAIPRLRAKLPKSREPGSARLCDTVLVI